jgi:hypothetical protein
MAFDKLDNEVADILGMNEPKEPSAPKEFPTDVEGLTADGVVKRGKDEFPVFNVDKNSFYQNMIDGRRRIRFPTGSKAQKYIQNTKYKRDFYIRHTEDDGKAYLKKIR